MLPLGERARSAHFMDCARPLIIGRRAFREVCPHRDDSARARHLLGALPPDCRLIPAACLDELLGVAGRPAIAAGTMEGLFFDAFSSIARHRRA